MMRLPIVPRNVEWDFSNLVQAPTRESRAHLPNKVNSFGLSQRDSEDIGYDLTQLSIFFPKPIVLDIEGLAATEWGMGYGGLSTSLFLRSTDCNQCGACCKNGHRTIWFWYAHEDHPEGVPAYQFEINGVEIPIWVHVNSQNGYAKCDYLVPLGYESRDLRGPTPAEGCSLHVPGLKPSHCSVNPQTGVWKTLTQHGLKLMLSRRLPSRNWRYPLCPIDVYNLQMNDEQIRQDEIMWAHWRRALKYVPGHCIEQAYDLWRATHEQIRRDPEAPIENIYFR